MKIIVVLLTLQFGAQLHPFHVSVCDVEVNESAKAIQISQRIFLDDLEQTLNKVFGTNLVIDEIDFKAERDSLIQAYLADRLKISVDGKELQANYLGSEFEEDGIWCYLEIEKVKRINEIAITSTILFEEFDDQANIIHFKHDEYERSVKLDRKKSSVLFTLPKE